MLFASSISVNEGWNLVGAVNNIDPSKIDCAKTIWVYNPDIPKKWSLYQTIDSSQNFGFDNLAYINKGQGFWLNSNCDTAINYADATGNSFNLFGFYWTNIKKDERYTVLGNNAIVDNNIIKLEAHKQDNIQSRAEARTYLKKLASSANVDVRLMANGNNDTNGFKYTYFQFQTRSNIIDNGVDKKAYCSIALKGKAIYATVWIEDDNGNETKAFPSDSQPNNAILEFNDSNPLLLGKNINLEIKKLDNKIVFSSSGDVNGSVTYTPPSDIVLNDIDRVVTRVVVDDKWANNENATSASLTKAEVTNVAVEYIQKSDINIQAEDATLKKWSEISTGVSVEEDEDGYYNVWDIDSSSFNVIGYEYEDESWVNDENHTGTVAQNGDYNISITTNDGLKADLIITKTQKVLSIEDINLSSYNIYKNDIEFHITDINTSHWDTDIWSWENPSYWNGSSDINVTNNDELLKLFLNAPVYFGDEKAMLDGSGTSGNVVQGVWTGEYYDSCDDGDCKIYKRTSTVIGSWEYKNNKIFTDLNSSYRNLSLIQDDGNYLIQEETQDKVGSIWKETLFTGDDTKTIELIKSLVSQ
jgi:hypothetical protein